MKEEQNASSSANYDVELFHTASAHTRLFSIDGYSATAPVDLQSWMPQVSINNCLGHIHKLHSASFASSYTTQS